MKFDRKGMKAEVRRLSEVESWKGIATIAWQWFIIAVAITIAQLTLKAFSGTFDIWTGFARLSPIQLAIVLLVDAVAIVTVASRQHALGIIMHDATHYLVLKHRLANDVVTDLTCCFPLGLSTSLYRRQHFDHHLFTNTDRDPYWVQMEAAPNWNWPKSKGAALRLLVGDCFGLNLPDWGKIITHWSPWAHFFDSALVNNRERITLLGFWATVLTSLWVTGSWLGFVIFWLLPQLTLLNAFVRIRSIAEHLVLDNTHELNRTRHVDGHWWERPFISPLNINYHIDHHVFPSIPLYNLPELHALLIQDREYQTKAIACPSYISLWNHFTSSNSDTSAFSAS